MSSINVGAEQSDQEKVDAIHTGMIDLIAERDSLKQQLAEALAKLEKFEKMDPIVFVDSGHLREASNGNDMLIYAQCEQDEQGRLEPLYAHPQEVESDLDEQLRRT